MEGNIVNKFFSTIKNKINNKNSDNSESLDCAFSLEEINDLAKQNKDKIKELKKNPLIIETSKEIKPKKETIELKEPTESIEIIPEKEELITEEKTITQKKEITDIKENLPKESTNSYINLTEENQTSISESWKKINITKLDEHILKGKDILAHNYTITYGDDALEFVYVIRNEYDILIEYFIGFNNEKKGIPNKTIFSDKIDNEWKHLASYIKILEKIRNAKK